MENKANLKHFKSSVKPATAVVAMAWPMSLIGHDYCHRRQLVGFEEVQALLS